MVVAEKFVEEIESLAADQVLVLTVDKFFPPFARVSGERREGSLSTDTVLTIERVNFALKNTVNNKE